MKTIVTETNLIDLLVVCKSLPEDEIEQIEAFTGEEFDVESIAVSTYNMPGPRWTCRIAETGEPLAIAGYIQVGASIWRSYMLANERAWKEFGGEVTHHVKEVIENLARGQEHIRLETIALESRERARRWYDRVGLEYESTLRSYGAGGEDAVMYVKVHKPAEIIAPSGDIEVPRQAYPH
jgi:hypothetical protein